MAGLHIPSSLDGLRPTPRRDAVMVADRSMPHGLGDQLLALYASCDGFLIGSGIGVYAVEDIVERNATFEVASYAPGFVLFGDDSGGRGFLLDPRPSGTTVHASDLGDLDPAGFEAVADDLASWIAQLVDGEAEADRR